MEQNSSGNDCLTGMPRKIQAIIGLLTDSIDHEILVVIWLFSSLLGLSKNATLLLKNYISNRKQIVKMGDSLSSSLPLNYGVPQGSILGPPLFTVLHMARTYDTQLYYSFKDADTAEAMHQIQSDITFA